MNPRYNCYVPDKLLLQQANAAYIKLFRIPITISPDRLTYGCPPSNVWGPKLCSFNPQKCVSHELGLLCVEGPLSLAKTSPDTGWHTRALATMNVMHKHWITDHKHHTKLSTSILVAGSITSGMLDTRSMAGGDGPNRKTAAPLTMAP